MCHYICNGEYFVNKCRFCRMDILAGLEQSWTVLMRLDLSLTGMSCNVLNSLEPSWQVHIVLNRLDLSWYVLTKVTVNIFVNKNRFWRSHCLDWSWCVLNCLARLFLKETVKWSKNVVPVKKKVLNCLDIGSFKTVQDDFFFCLSWFDLRS
jgi:hypothetical protein